MTPLSCRILYIALPALLLINMFCAELVVADSIIRIIGDRAAKTPVPSGESTPTVQPVLPAGGSSTIRIIGDKPVSVRTRSDERTIGRQLGQASYPSKEIRITGDKSETTQKMSPAQATPTVDAEQEHRVIKQTAAEESPAKETADEQQLAQRLAALKAEEERKAAEKVEQERLAKIKIEQENEAARQAAIKQEQEQLAALKAEEQRKAVEKAEQEKAIAEAARQAAIKKEQDDQKKAAAEAAEAARQARIKKEEEQRAALEAEELRKAVDKAEQERIAAIKADEERLAVTRRALIAPPLPEPTLLQSGSTVPAADSPSVSANLLIGSGDNTTQSPATIWTLYLAAKANDPALGRTEARVTGSKAESDVLFSTLMPHLNSSAGVKQISQSLTNYSANDASYDFTALNYNVTASLTLLHVPTLYSMSAAAAGLNAEQAGVAAARQALIVKFTDSYFALLKTQADKQIAMGEINRLKQVLDQSQAFLKAGTGDIISVYEAQSRLDSAVADLTKSESNLRLAEQKLSSQVGKPVTDVVNYMPQQPVGPDPDNLDWWVETMEKEQPLIRQAREVLTQTSEQRKAAKSEYLPTLQASGGYDVNRGTAALPTAEVRQWFVGATISLPLYSGGETAAKVRRATASEEERRHIFDETMDQQRENVKQAFFNLRYNISLIKALDQRKASAEIQLAAVKKGRKIGTRNAIDVLNAEQTYSLALRDYRYALYDNVIRHIQLKSAAGILAEVDIAGLSKIEAPAPGVGLNMIISQTFR